MVIKLADNKPTIIQNMKGGKKYVQKYDSATKDTFTDNADIVARLVLIPGASLGYHEHVGNEETITVISGKAKVIDDGTEYILGPGDVTICREHHKHSIENVSEDEDLVIVIAVIKVPQAV